MYRCVMNDNLVFNATEQVAATSSTSKDCIFILAEERLVDMTEPLHRAETITRFFNKKVYTKLRNISINNKSLLSEICEICEFYFH